MLSKGRYNRDKKHKSNSNLSTPPLAFLRKHCDTTMIGTPVAKSCDNTGAGTGPCTGSTTRTRDDDCHDHPIYNLTFTSSPGAKSVNTDESSLSAVSDPALHNNAPRESFETLWNNYNEKDGNKIDDSDDDDSFSIFTRSYDEIVGEDDFYSISAYSMPLDYADKNAEHSTIISKQAIKYIKKLKTKLRVQEETKVELLNQCLALQKRIFKPAQENALKYQYQYRIQVLTDENRRLQEESRELEYNHIVDINELLHRLKVMDEELAVCDKKIAFFEAAKSGCKSDTRRS